MSETRISDIAFTPAVKAVQARLGAREAMARLQEKRDWADTMSPEVQRLIAAQDSVFLATASADGQPYVQHRGGSPGFLRALDARTLAFADFAGNRHYLTLGNISENDRAFLFVMDWPSATRVKLWGRLGVEEDPALAAALADPAYPAVVERVLRFSVLAVDVNCRQHIARRYSEREVAAANARLLERIAELEAEVARLEAARPDDQQG